MPSLVPGFEYDIFISYRHNDNKSRWVTEFVNHLNEELAAAIKEPVSVYFDSNPHDGLLETHHVDKSLEGKLKCLIFIPIISQTYCDPKSFAWRHEFVAFNKLAKEDQFERDVKLSNGNVASRILPVKIHDLDAGDEAIIENEIDGTLRAIEFIYKEPGVNRPLLLSDSKSDNLNKTDYRNQINKLANAIKEIIHSVSSAVSQPAEHRKSATTTPTNKRSRLKSFVGVTLFVVIIITYFLFPKLFEHSKLEPEKSVAVLSFVDMSPTHDQEYLGDGIAEEIINVLAQAKDLKVIARSSSFQFKGKNEDLRTIGQKLGVSTVLEGSILKANDRIKVTAQLINTSDGSHVWSKRFDQNTTDVFLIQDSIAWKVAEAFKATMDLHATSQLKNDWNEEAYKLYQQGRFFYERASDEDQHRALEYFRKSVAIDSSQAIALTFLGWSERILGLEKESNKHLIQSYHINPKLEETLVLMAERAIGQGDAAKAKELFLKLNNSNTSNTLVLRTLSLLCSVFGKYEESLRYSKKAVELDPLQPWSFHYLGESYMHLQKYAEALNIFERIPELSNNFRSLDQDLFFCYLMISDFKKAQEKLDKVADLDERNFFQCILDAKKGDKLKSDQGLEAMKKKFGNDTNALAGFALLHAYRGESKKAIDFLQRMYATQPKRSLWILADWGFVRLRSDPEFVKILRQVQLVD